MLQRNIMPQIIENMRNAREVNNLHPEVDKRRAERLDEYFAWCKKNVREEK